MTSGHEHNASEFEDQNAEPTHSPEQKLRGIIEEQEFALAEAVDFAISEAHDMLMDEVEREQQSFQEQPSAEAHPESGGTSGDEGLFPTAQEPAAPAIDEATRAALIADILAAAAYLASLTSFEDLVKQSLSRIIDVLPLAHAGVLWLYDQRQTRLYAAATCHLPLEQNTLHLLKNSTFNPGEGLVGHIFQCSEPLIIDRHMFERSKTAPFSVRLTPENDALRQQMDQQMAQSNALVMIPLRTPDYAVGVLALVNLDQEPPDMRDLEALKQPLFTLGGLLAALIKNKQLYDQSQLHRSRLDAFDAVVTAISTATDLQDLLRSVLDVMLGLLPVASGAIFLLDPSEARLTLGTHHDLPADYVSAMHSFPVSGSDCEEVVRYGQPTLRPLIDQRSETMLLCAGLESCAYLPLLAGGTVVGVLALFGDAMLYKDIDMTRLMPLGNQVGFAIANVRLYEDSYLERRKLNTVINSIAEGVVVCDSQGRLTLANEAAMELFSLEAIPIQQPLSEMPDFYSIRDLEGRPLPVEQLPMARALSGETFHDYRVLLHGISGDNSVMSFSGAPLYADNQTIEGAVVIFRDITANQKLERAKDEFLAVAAHELRSPLAAVRSYAEMLLRRERQRTSDSESRDLRGLTILSQQVTHMLRMVDNLLDVSRLDAGQLDLQLQRVNLVSLATQVLDQQRPAATGQELVLEADQPELWIECDSMRVRQILTNLVNNAIKYSPPDTIITVHLTTRTVSFDQQQQVGAAEPLSIELGQSSTSDMDELETTRFEALVRVCDQGCGIPSDQQARLFERFFRAKNRRAEGLGLGLYLSRQFVLMHGGNVWVDSTEGQGCTFCFTLPMRPDS